MRLLRFAVPCVGTLSLLASSSLFAAAEAHPNHHWQNRRAALEEMPVVRDYPDGYGTAAQLPVRRAPLRRVARSGQVLAAGQLRQATRPVLRTGCGSPFESFIVCARNAAHVAHTSSEPQRNPHREPPPDMPSQRTPGRVNLARHAFFFV